MLPIAIIGALFFFLFSLGKPAIIAMLIAIFIQTRGAKLELPKINFTAYSLSPQSGTPFAGQLTALLFLALLFFLVARSSSDGLISSPWSLLPSFFLPLFFLATVLLIFLMYKKSSSFFPALYFLMFFGVAAIIYKLGYGFDQFVHEAGQNYILAHGTISPKSLQYIGLYSINIFLNQAAGIQIATLNRFLLPILSMIIVPICYFSFKKENKDISTLALLAILFLPFSSFIVSTPQGVANLLLLLLIFINHKGWALPLTILLIHPITGIIAIIYQALVNFRFKKIIIIAGALAIPLAFSALSFKYGGLHINFYLWDALKDYASFLTAGGLQKNYNIFLDLIYLLQFLTVPILIAISVWTAIKFKKELNLYPFYLFLISTASFFITRIFVDFSYLISYEQKNYPERIFVISLIFLAPYLVFAANRFISFIEKREITYKVFFILLFAFVLTANFYLTYPRFDNYKNDKGKNLTSDMLYAVEAVKRDANNKDYVVLTDQTVSAGALKLDGFKKYYSTPLGDVFYYPIPTGGPLYNEFLNLVYNNAGSRAAQNAKILTGAQEAYIILPSYWENYKKIKENLLLEMKPVLENENIAVLKL